MNPKRFCEYCDNGPNGFDNCEQDKVERYAKEKEWCPFAHIDGVRVILEPNRILFIDAGNPKETIYHYHIIKIRQRIKESKQVYQKPNHPSQSPFERAIAKTKSLSTESL